MQMENDESVIQYHRIRVELIAETLREKERLLKKYGYLPDDVKWPLVEMPEEDGPFDVVEDALRADRKDVYIKDRNLRKQALDLICPNWQEEWEELDEFLSGKERRGTYAEALKKVLAMMDVCTFTDEYALDGLRIFAVLPPERPESELPNQICFAVLDPIMMSLNNIRNTEENVFSEENQVDWGKQEFGEKGFSASDIENIKARGYLLQYIYDPYDSETEGLSGGEKREPDTAAFFVPHSGLMAKLCQSLGEGTYADGVNPFAYLHLASRIKAQEKCDLMLISRGLPGCPQKMLSCLKKAREIPQLTALEVQEALGNQLKTKAEIRFWIVTQEVTVIDIAFPELEMGATFNADRTIETDGYTPGASLSFSGIGEHAFMMEGVVFSRGGMIPVPERSVKAKQTISFQFQELVKEFLEKKFPDVQAICKRLTDEGPDAVLNVKQAVESMLEDSGVSGGQAYGKKKDEEYRKSAKWPDVAGTKKDVMACVFAYAEKIGRSEKLWRRQRGLKALGKCLGDKPRRGMA